MSGRRQTSVTGSTPQDAARHGYVVRPDRNQPGSVEQVEVPIDDALSWEAKGEASLAELDKLFTTD